MNFKAEQIAYSTTNSFSKIVTDYIDGNSALQPFYKNEVSLEGIKNSIVQRQYFKTDRQLLTQVLKEQYFTLELTAKQKENLALLEQDNCFTITTAHQPNIFTGPLYFIYKILHAIKLAEFCKKELPENNFVPIYYMGSEDADLDEQNHIFIDGYKHQWQTSQKGAVGRMRVDDNLVKLLANLSGQLSVLPYGNEIVEALKKYYQLNVTIEKATFQFVNYLFAQYGLLIVLPDNAKLKKAFIPVLKKEITTQFSAAAVKQTVATFPNEYKVQASGRELNLFYLIDDKRERIEKVDDEFVVVNTAFKFTHEQLLNEIDNYPERFSPNVILRPVFQETILPNVVFIGGGGELAYWLELKKVFEAVSVSYPLLVLRNSYLIVNKEQQKLIQKLNLTTTNLFKPVNMLLNELVKTETDKQLYLTSEKEAIKEVYQKINELTTSIDTTLQKHTQALQTKTLNKLEALESKMLKAEKKKFEVQKRQLEKIKQQLFPQNNLQERIESVLPFYANYGRDCIEALYNAALPIGNQFTILTIE